MVAWLCFIMAGYIGMLHHEIWMDEAYHYLVASHGVVWKHYSDGHPVLWRLLLYVALKIHNTVFTAQLLHLCIASATAFLLLFRSPFSLFQKICICFGYYFFYEYSLITKNYALGIFFLLLAMDVFLSHPKRLVLICLLLALSANSHFFTCLLSLCLLAYILYAGRKELKPLQLILPALIVLPAIAWCVYEVVPSEQLLLHDYLHADTAPFISAPRLNRFACLAGKGIVNVPDFGLGSYWNSNVFESFSKYLCLLVSLCTWLFMWRLFRRHKAIMLLFTLSVCAVSAAIYCLPLQTGVRYWGFAYVMLVICLWLKYRQNGQEDRLNKNILNVLLFIQLLVGITAYAIDYNRPFSNAKYAAMALRQSTGLRHPLFVQALGQGPSLSAYCDRAVYYPTNKAFETFSYSNGLHQFKDTAFVNESLKDMDRLKIDTCVLVMTAPLKDDRQGLSAIGSYTGALIGSENYFLYLLGHKHQP